MTSPGSAAKTSVRVTRLRMGWFGGGQGCDLNIDKCVN